MTERPAAVRVRSHHLGLAAFGLILLVATIALPVWADAATFRTDDEVTVAAGETIADDLYAIADTLDVDGTVERDAFAAARVIDIGGTIDGALNATAGDIDISGTVAHSVRVVAGSVDVTGTIAGDLMVVGGTTTIAAGAEVDGDVHVYGGTLTVEGDVGGDIGGNIGTLEIHGEVAGSVRTDVERLEVGSEAAIEGELSYVSPGEGDIASGADIGGDVDRQSVAPWGMEPGVRARFFSPLVRTLWLLVTGAFVIAVAPRLATALNETLERPLPSAIAGLVALVGIPILAVLLLATVIGIPAGLLLVAAYVAALYLSQYVVGQRIGAWLLPNRWADGSRGHLLLSMTIGVLLLSVLRYVPVPFVGTIVNLLVAILGLGAAVLVLGRLRPRYVVSRA